MSYLTSYATRNRRFRGRGIDEKLRLNLRGFHGGAYVRVFVEDTTFRKWRRRPPHPHVRLRITDCSNEIDTLLGALQRFRDALDAEAELYAHREQHRKH